MRQTDQFQINKVAAWTPCTFEIATAAYYESGRNLMKAIAIAKRIKAGTGTEVK